MMLLAMNKSMPRIGHRLEGSSSPQTTRDDAEQHLESLLLDPGFQDFLHLESAEELFDPSTFLSVVPVERVEQQGLANVISCQSAAAINNTTCSVHHSVPIHQITSVSPLLCWHRPNETHTSSCYQQQQQQQQQQDHQQQRYSLEGENREVPSNRQFHQGNSRHPPAPHPMPTTSSNTVVLSHVVETLTKGSAAYPGSERVEANVVYQGSQGLSSLPRTMTSPTVHVQTAFPHGSSVFTPPSHHHFQGNFAALRQQPCKLGIPLPYHIPQKADPKLQVAAFRDTPSPFRQQSLKTSTDNFFYEPQTLQYLDPTVSAAKRVSSPNIFSKDYIQQGISSPLKSDPRNDLAEAYGPLVSDNNAGTLLYTSSSVSGGLQKDSMYSSSSTIATSEGAQAFNMNPMTQPSSVETVEDFTSIDMADTESYCDSQIEFDQDGRRQQKLHHSEIEKRRRDKMNAYIVELAGLVPMCRDLNRKLDKLSVLRMAVQHIKTSRGSCDTLTEVSQLPSSLPEEGVKDVILKASEGFTFAVSCDRGNILFVSESVANILHYKPDELTGQNLFDFIYQRDIQKVKDQLAAAEFLPKEKFIDATTMKLVKTSAIPNAHSRLNSGSRRLFVCRMKKKTESAPPHDSDFKVPYAVNTPSSEHSQNKQNSEDGGKNQAKCKQDNSFMMMRCVGYIKQKVTVRSVIQEDKDDAGDSADPLNLHCLIAVAIPTKIADAENVQSSQSSDDNIKLRSGNREFMSRHSLDGKFVFVDHRVTGVLGYVPQEMIGTSIYEYCHPDYIQSLSAVHKEVLKNKKKLHNKLHKFRTRDGSTVTLSTTMFVFVNPWTKESEQLICTHQLTCSAATSNFVTSSTNERKQKEAPANDQQSGEMDVTVNLAYLESEEQKVTSSSDTEVEQSNSSKCEQQQQRQQQQPRSDTEERPRQPLPGNISQIGRDVMAEISRQQRQGLRRNVNLNYTSDSSSCQSSSGAENTDGAAMSIIMNLLEAEAGLGGPVDFNDLPWPL